MKKTLKEYLEQKNRRTWFYTHLKKDPEFKHDAANLRERIAIDTEHGKYNPTMVVDFEYLEDPEKDVKIALIEAFMNRWNIHWDYALLSFLLIEDENTLPPQGKAAFAVSTHEERNMFEIQIPFSVQHEDMEYLWLLLQSLKRDVGIDIAKKPRKNTYNATKTELAYQMWRLRTQGKTWTQVVQEINTKYKRTFDIKSAQRHLKAYGYYL
jgi:hypothetical protein